jgi:hypothetical protein
MRKSSRRSSGSSPSTGTIRRQASAGIGRSPSATLRTTSPIQAIAASATRLLYSALFAIGWSGMSNTAVAHTGPASSSSTADSAVTPQRSRPSRIAWSSDEGPRSPTGPGCTMTVGQRS